MTDYSLWATLFPVRDKDLVGSAVRIRITQDLDDVPVPSPDKQSLTPKGFWRQEGTLSVIDHNGQWLVAKVGEDHGPVETLQRKVVIAFRQVRGSLKFLDFHITKEHKNELGEYISPHQMNMLTPGRIPAGLRYTYPDNYEVWISLGETHDDV